MPDRIALQRAAAALAEARAVEATAQAEVARVTEALDRARQQHFEAEEAAEEDADRAAAELLGELEPDRRTGETEKANRRISTTAGSRLNSSPIGAERAAAIVARLERRFTAALEARDRAKSAVSAADLQHRKAAMAVLALEAEGIAFQLGGAERLAAKLWRSLDTLSRLWLAGADAGPPRFGPQATAALQTPPRLASVDLPPVAVAEVTRGIADEWRARFAELLGAPPEKAKAA
jgi:hypothetical protein